MERQTKNILIGSISAFLLVLLLQNTQVVTLRLLFWQISMSQIILIPLVLGLGFVIGFLVGKKSW